MISIRIDRVKELFFSFLLLVFCSNMIMQARANRGLVNCANACYMNSAFQCLSNVPGFYDFLNANEQYYKPDSMTSEVLNLFKEIRKESETAKYDASNFEERLASTLFGEEGAQQNAADFLNKLIFKHVMNEDFKAISGGFTETKRSELFNELKGFFYLGLKDKSELAFGDDPPAFEDLRPIVPLNLALAKHEAGRDVPLNNLNECLLQRLDEKKISSLPETLMLAFDRSPSQVTITSIEGTEIQELLKNKNPIKFPFENLDMRDYLDFEAKNKYERESTTYNLIGIICHVGEEVATGHYVAYVKDAKSDDDGARWYRYDDRSDAADPTSELIGVISMDSGEIKRIVGAGYVAEVDHRPEEHPTILFYQLKKTPVPEVTVPVDFGSKIWEYTATVVNDLTSKFSDDDLQDNGLRTISSPNDVTDVEKIKFYKKAALLIIDGAGADLGLLANSTSANFKNIKKENSEEIRKLFGSNPKAAYLYRLMKTFISKLVVDKFLNKKGDGFSDDGAKWKNFYVNKVDDVGKTLYKRYVKLPVIPPAPPLPTPAS